VPVPAAPLVLGKWLAAWLTTLAVVAPGAVFVVLVRLWGAPDPGPAATGFLGLALMAAALAALGTLASSATASQPVAALAAAFAGTLLWFAHTGPAVAPGALLARVSLSERLRSFAAGAVDAGDTTFLLALAATALAVAVLAIDLRRLR
jgi:ABC-2 type transport system permease protein